MVMEGLNLLAGSLAKTQAAKPAGVSAWAIVTGTVPLTVQLLDDPQGNTVYVAANAAGPVEVGWAVLVEVQNNRVTLRSAPPQLDALNSRIGLAEGRASALESSVNTGSDRLSALRTGITNLESLNAGSRLASLEARKESFQVVGTYANGTSWTAGAIKDLTVSYPSTSPIAPVSALPIFTSSPGGSGALVPRLVSVGYTSAVVRAYNAGSATQTITGTLDVRVAIIMP